MISAPCCRFLLFQYTMMAQICKEKSEPAYAHGGVQNPCYRSIVSNTDIFERKAVALHQAKAADETEAINDEKKAKTYYHFMDSTKVKMAGYMPQNGSYVKGIEDYLPPTQYNCDEHHQKVVEDIVNNWQTLSHGGKFHSLFATSSIPEAITYYRLLKQALPALKITALFDPNIDNTGGAVFKEDGLVEIIEDYNVRYE